MDIHPDVRARLERLTPDQRAAATAPPGPVLCVAPAGSGKTTTLIARIAWLTATGVDPATICAITFNKRAAEELDDRLVDALAAQGLPRGAVRVRTFHALGLEVLRDAGQPVEPLVDRMTIVRQVTPAADAATRRALDTAISRLKLDIGVTADEVATDLQAGPVALAFVAYERAVQNTGGLDFDDLIVRALRALDDVSIRRTWRQRCAHLLVDEVQDVDRSQLELTLVLAAPANRVFLVGDDDQSIYGWRLADVRRVIGLAARLPGLRRHDLVTNFRCPSPVVTRAVRLIETNRERFAKRIVARDGAAGRLVLAPDAGDDDVRVRRVIASWPRDGDSSGTACGTRAILARTNRELLPAAAVALELGIPFRADRLTLLLEDPRLDSLLASAEAVDEPGQHGGRTRPLLVRLNELRHAAATSPGAPPWAPGSSSGAPPPLPDDLDPPEDLVPLDELIAALLGWAAPYRDVPSFVAVVRARREALATLRRDDANLTLATAHSTKGLEFDHVAVVDMDADRFPSRRSLDDALEPDRALEEERRLAYVAWTRARRSLTLVYDPEAPSRFLREAFDEVELGPIAKSRRASSSEAEVGPAYHRCGVHDAPTEQPDPIVGQDRGERRRPGGPPDPVGVPT
jgi:superfamily I DNA/RNA helicase